MLKPDTAKTIFTYAYASAVLAVCFYSLVLYPYDLDQLVKGALIGWGTLAINSVFSDQAATRTAHQAASATAAAQTGGSSTTWTST